MSLERKRSARQRSERQVTQNISERVVEELEELEEFVLAVHAEADRIIALLEQGFGELSAKLDAQRTLIVQEFNGVVSALTRVENAVTAVNTSVDGQTPILHDIQKQADAQTPVVLDIQRQIHIFTAGGSRWAEPPATSVDLEGLRKEFLSQIKNPTLRSITAELFAEQLTQTTQVLPERELHEAWEAATRALLAQIDRETPSPLRAGRRVAAQNFATLLNSLLIKFVRTARALAVAVA